MRELDVVVVVKVLSAGLGIIYGASCRVVVVVVVVIVEAVVVVEADTLVGLLFSR